MVKMNCLRHSVHQSVSHTETHCRRYSLSCNLVSYNKAFRIMHILSKRCSVSLMFASSGTDCCDAVIRKRTT